MKTFIKAAAVAISLGVAGVACAQTTYGSTLGNVDATNFAIRAGALFPLDADMRNVSNVWVAVGVDYTFQKSLLPDSTTYLSVDWLGKTANGAKGNVFPICLNERFNFSKGYQGYQTYGFVGVGGFFTDVTTSKAVVGARGGLGVNLGPNIFSEATLYLSDAANGFRTVGVGVYLGYRF